MKCPNCHECQFERGVCGRLANRGRRFFLLGALALPVAAKIAHVAPVLAAPPKITVSTARVVFNGRVWEWDHPVKEYNGSREVFSFDFGATWAVAT